MNFLKALFTPSPPVVHQVTAHPVVLQPTLVDHVGFAAWRAGHIQRWLDDQDNAGSPKRDYLIAERDMHLAAIKMEG